MHRPSISPDLAAAMEEERALDRAFQHHAGERAAQQSGVCWSGPPVPSALARSPREIETAARARLKRHQTWLAQDTTAWLQAMIDLQTTSRTLHGLAERGRETWSRGLPGELTGARDLSLRIRDHILPMLQALDRADAALQALQKALPSR